MRAEPRRTLRRPYPSQPTVRQGRQRSSPWPGDRAFESWSLQQRVRSELHCGGLPLGKSVKNSAHIQPRNLNQTSGRMALSAIRASA